MPNLKQVDFSQFFMPSLSILWSSSLGLFNEGRDICFKYGQVGHCIKDYLIKKVVMRANKNSVTSSSTPTPRNVTSTFVTGPGFSVLQNRLYALLSWKEFEVSLDVVTSTLQLFSHNVYYLLDPGSTLSCVTPYVAVSFSFDLEVVSDFFLFLL